MSTMKTLQEVRIQPKNVDDYIEFIGKDKIDELKRLAQPLRNKRILNINATAYGGGVAELLKTQVGIMQNLGLNVDWYVMTAPQEFYGVTKLFHNTLQGNPQIVTDEEKEIYLKTVKNNAQSLEKDYDIILVHDPQPLAMIDFVKNSTAKWIWRCHIDTSERNHNTWDFLYPYMKNYDATIFTLDEFVPQEADFNHLTFIPPSIDPLSPKNNEMSVEEVNNLVYSYNIDPERPLITQVSRFDPWKDPLGVIEVYRNIKYSQPAKTRACESLQLALIGGMANDDPEGWSIYDRVLRRAGEDFDLNIYTNFHNVGDVGVKAFQYASDIILQKSLKEGFGLTVSEGLWKAKPVIGGRVGGIKIQIEDGVNGFLVSSIEEATEKTRYLLENPAEAKKMGEKGKETVRSKFLSTREIADHLKLFNDLLFQQK